MRARYAAVFLSVVIGLIHCPLADAHELSGHVAVEGRASIP